MAEWSHLPADLLHMISTRLNSSIDTVRFRSVCSAWRSAVLTRPNALYTPFPDLSQDGFSAIFGGFFLSKRSIYLLSHPASPNPHSWMIKTEPGRPGFLRVFNPMSRSQIKPTSSVIPNSIDLSNVRVCELGQEFVLQYANHTLGGHYSNLYMEKVACLPVCDRDYVLLTVHISGKLAVYKSAARKWSVISDPESLYDDVIMFDGKFYAVEGSGRAVIVEASGDQNMAVSQVAGPVNGGDRKCLVKLGRDLLLVDIHLGFPAEDGANSGDEDGNVDGQGDGLDNLILMRPIRLRVFKLGKEGEGWIEVRSLGDHVLFLGDNCTFSARASDLLGCKGNCICFNLGEYQYPSNVEEGDAFRFRDIGVFSLENGKIEPCETYPSYSKLFWPPPSWVASASPEE